MFTLRYHNMRNRVVGASVVALAVALLAMVPTGVGTGAVAHADESVNSIPVSFEVINKNDSKAPCPADGKRYTVRGHLTGPTDKLDHGSRQDSVTLYNHGHSFAEYLWNFDKVPGYNTVGELAKRGHISVTYDRLGYGRSGKPNGTFSCYGSEADVSHQIVNDLRSGNYHIDRGHPISFKRVAYVGHEQEAFGGEAMAYSFHNIDAFAYLDFADGVLAPSLYTSTGSTPRTACWASPVSRDWPGPPAPAPTTPTKTPATRAATPTEGRPTRTSARPTSTTSNRTWPTS